MACGRALRRLCFDMRPRRASEAQIGTSFPLGFRFSEGAGPTDRLSMVGMIMLTQRGADVFMMRILLPIASSRCARRGIPILILVLLLILMVLMVVVVIMIGTMTMMLMDRSRSS
jgi:hypothetical protein